MLSLNSSSKVTLTGEMCFTSSQLVSAQLSREGRVEREGCVREGGGGSEEGGGMCEERGGKCEEREGGKKKRREG